MSLLAEVENRLPNADFVIEDYVDPREPFRGGGPFGDHTGCYTLPAFSSRWPPGLAAQSGTNTTAFTHTNTAGPIPWFFRVGMVEEGPAGLGVHNLTCSHYLLTVAQTRTAQAP
jgi:hypothetical protein